MAANRWGQCMGKVAHESKAGARAEAERTNMDFYMCPLCSHWHVGHRTRRARRGLDRNAAGRRAGR